MVNISNDSEIESERFTSSNIGFALLRELDDGTCYIGGIFVADSNLRPVEFRCTSPIRPSNVQKTLYGSELVPVIAQDLVLKNVLNKLSVKPNLLLCGDQVFLEARKFVDIPIIVLEAEARMPTSSDDEKIETTLLHNRSGKFNTLQISTLPGFSSDGEEWLGFLQFISNSRDLLEPFERISNALMEVYKSKS
ncbi:MAG TPA: hypothetical protein VGB30_13830 [bacterium]